MRGLADGRFHSGSELAATMGVGRGAVWKQIEHLRRCGLVVHAVRGRGYRLASPVEWLDAEQIGRWLGDTDPAPLPQVEVVPETDSTNSQLLGCLARGESAPRALLAEIQRAGRGRQGRRWHSPPGGSLALSVGWRFHRLTDPPAAASLVAGLAVAEALEETGVAIGLKWPNDLLAGGEKLGGILVEMRGDPTAACDMVVGVGLNLRLSEAARDTLDRPVTDLYRLAGEVPARNRLAGRILHRLARTLYRFGREGFSPFRGPWQQRDLLIGRQVRVETPAGDLAGVVLGVDEQGALLLESEGRRHRLVSAEVHLGEGW